MSTSAPPEAIERGWPKSASLPDWVVPELDKDEWNTIRDALILQMDKKFEEACKKLLDLIEEKKDLDKRVVAECEYRLSRWYVDWSETVSDATRKSELVGLAVDYAAKSVESDGTSAPAFKAVSVAAGAKASLAGTATQEKIELSRKIKEYIDKSLELDPNNASTWHILGRWNSSLASQGMMTRMIVKVVYGGFPAASWEKAHECFAKAIELFNAIPHQVEIGKVCLHLKKKAEAKEHFQKALQMECEFPTDYLKQEEAKKELEKL